VLQAAVKRILKEKSYPYEIYNESHKKSYFPCSVIKSYFVYFQPNSMRKPLKQYQNIGWNYYITRSKLHPANRTHLVTLRMLAKTWVNQVIWMKCNALPKNAWYSSRKEINLCQYMFSICFKRNTVYVFPYFEPFISAGFNKTWDYNILCLFSLVMLLCAVCAAVYSNF